MPTGLTTVSIYYNKLLAGAGKVASKSSGYGFDCFYPLWSDKLLSGAGIVASTVTAYWLNECIHLLQQNVSRCQYSCKYSECLRLGLDSRKNKDICRHVHK